MLHLVALEGPDRGRVFEFAIEEFTLGRAGSPDRNLQYPVDATMSREHVHVRVQPETVDLRVLGRASSIFAGGAEHRVLTVAYGEPFRVGHTLLVAKRAERVEEDDSLPRRALSDFRILEELGGGASAKVYAASDTTSSKQLALKIFHPEMTAIEPAVSLFVREMQIQSVLRHPHIVRTLCVGRENRELFIGMELIDGFSLEEHVSCMGPLSPRETCQLGACVLRALDFAHSSDLVHRDVKPSNIMIENEDFLSAYLVDFGMAKYVRPRIGIETLTRTGEVRGTLLYSPPECFQDAKRAGPAADVFAVGTTLYFALTGATWFDETILEDGAFSGALAGEVVPIRHRSRSVPPELARIVEGAIRPDPAERWDSAAEMLHMLTDFHARAGGDP